MDKDGSGLIDQGEFVRGITAFFGEKYASGAINALFESFDNDGSGNISYAELQEHLKDTSTKSLWTKPPTPKIRTTRKFTKEQKVSSAESPQQDPEAAAAARRAKGAAAAAKQAATSKAKHAAEGAKAKQGGGAQTDQS
eukprot:6089893-Prymnesium_polylepis.1